MEESLRVERESQNGYEVTVCLRSEGHGNYCWVAIRYPLDLSNTEETEILYVFNNKERVHDWVSWLREYGYNHPDDGIYFI